jgi:hypothetical protein
VSFALHSANVFFGHAQATRVSDGRTMRRAKFAAYQAVRFPRGLCPRVRRGVPIAYSERFRFSVVIYSLRLTKGYARGNADTEA